MSYAGIDYSRGMSNVDHATGIHYGIIPSRDLAEWAQDEFEPFYGKPHCPECESELDPDIMECKLHGEIDGENAYPEDAICWTYEKDGYSCEMAEDGDIWIFKAPFTTHAQFCSPCAPGAGYLLNPCEDGPKTYCFGQDWFEDEKAPYPIEEVTP